MIRFSIVPPGRERDAYEWHRGFAAQNPHILPRPWSDYQTFADNEQVWCARDERGDFLGLAYYAHESKTWELGGLMVAASERKNGLGSTLIRLLLGHLLCTEDPLSQNHRIIAHVHADNKDALALAEKVLAFRNAGLVQRQWYSTSAENAATMVKGYEFHLVKPSSLVALADWCSKWKNKLPNGKDARIIFAQKAESLRRWAEALLDMAKIK